MICSFLSLLTLALTVAQGQDERDDGLLAIVGANVVTMEEPGQVLVDRSVLVRAGRIVAVVPSHELEVPDGCQVVAAEGRYLVPGLADMHVHLQGDSDLLLNVAAGVTTVRNLWGNPRHLDMRRRADRTDFLGPTVYTTGPIVDGVPPAWDGSVGLDDPEAARAEVLRQAEAGYEAIKVYNSLREDVYFALVDAARENDLRVTGHVPDAVGIRTVLEIGQDCIEHLEGYFSFTASGPAGDVDELVGLTVEAGTWNCVTLVVIRNISMLGDADVLKARPEMRFVSPLTRASWDPAFDWRFKNYTRENFAFIAARLRSMQAFTRALHEAGAGLLVGTDTPNPYVVPGFAVHEELALLVEAGLSPYAALHAATVAPAEYLERRDEFGRVAVGLRADLVLLEGNPLEDIAHTRRRAGVVVRGRWLGADDLDLRLEELASSYVVDFDALLRQNTLELVGEGEARIEGLYEVRLNGVRASLERVAVHGRGDGGEVILARALDPRDPEFDPRLRVDVDAQRHIERFDYREQHRASPLRAEGRRSAKGLVVSFGAEGQQVEKELGLGAGPVLTLPMAGALQLLGLRLLELAPGDTQTYLELEIGLEPLDVDAGLLRVRALPRAPGDASRSFEVESETDSRRIELTLDGDGRLRSAGVKRQIGRLDYRRRGN